jgi:hypothetical protein
MTAQHARKKQKRKLQHTDEALLQQIRARQPLPPTC